mgnify:CR=1
MGKVRGVIWMVIRLNGAELRRDTSQILSKAGGSFRSEERARRCNYKL